MMNASLKSVAPPARSQEHHRTHRGQFAFPFSWEISMPKQHPALATRSVPRMAAGVSAQHTPA
jgi:hypothetical protein